MGTSKKVLRRKRIHMRIRKQVVGTAERPRLSVYRSNKHIYAQFIDDTVGRTIASASSKAEEIVSKASEMNKVEQAKLVGKLAAEQAKAAGIETIIFDRGGYLYHGRVKALAEGAREGGLKF